MTPRSPLLAGATYTVIVNGALDETGAGLSFAGPTFTTQAVPTGGNPLDPPSATATNHHPSNPSAQEQWIPTADNFQGDWRSGRPASRWQSLRPLKAKPGGAALAGQVSKLDGKPLANVTVMFGGKITQTNHTGRFLLEAIPARQAPLTVNAQTASTPHQNRYRQRRSASPL